jgi:hypothetical protein
MVTATTISLVATTATAVAVALYFLSKNAETVSSDVVPSKSPAPTPVAPPVPVPPPAESPTKNDHTTSAEISPKKKKKIDVRVSGDEGGKERSKAESRVAPALIPEATSEGEPFVNSVVSRGILTQPADLLTAANPPPKSGEKKRAKPKPISSWAAGL